MSFNPHHVQRSPSFLFMQGSPGYKRLITLWTSYVSRKVTECLQAVLGKYVQPGKAALRDLDTEQVLLLSLLHCLLERDVTACFVLAEIITKVEPLKSPSLAEWLVKDFSFTSNEIRKVLSFAAELSKMGINFSDIFLNVLENIYEAYCSPRKRDSYTCGLAIPPPVDEEPEAVKKEEQCNDSLTTPEPTARPRSPLIDHLLMNEQPVVTSDSLPIPKPSVRKRSPLRLMIDTVSTADKGVPGNQEPENRQGQCTNIKNGEHDNTLVVLRRSFAEFPTPTPSPLPRSFQRPRKIHISPTQKLTTVFPKHILGEYTTCEQYALVKEHESSAKVIDSPISPRFLGTLPATPYERSTDPSRDFVMKEASASSLTAISDLASEADSINEKTGDTALHLAVARDNLNAVVELIRRGSPIDVTNKVNITPLQIAVERENLPIIKELHRAGADINLKNSSGESLLHKAAASAGLETIELLIDLGAELDSLDTRQQTPLFYAAKKGYVVVMEKLEEGGADIHVTDNFDRSLLHYAAWHGQNEAVEWLLDNNLDITSRTKHGWTPLHWAVANGQRHTTHTLLKRGADVNAKDYSQRTPLYWAIQGGNVELIDLLKSFRGNV